MCYLLTLWGFFLPFHCPFSVPVVGFCPIPSSTKLFHLSLSTVSIAIQLIHLGLVFRVSHHLSFGYFLGCVPSILIYNYLMMSSSLFWMSNVFISLHPLSHHVFLIMSFSSWHHFTLCCDILTSHGVFQDYS